LFWYNDRMACKRTLAVVSALVVCVVAMLLASYVAGRPSPQSAAEHSVDAVLAVRGFRHQAKQIPAGQSGEYSVDVGEQLKVTWQVVNASEDGQLIYHGPVGVGAGLVPIPREPVASQSGAFLSFTPRTTGDATFQLTVTGPGPGGVYSPVSTLTVHILPVQ
jgi:hypothetical protein